MPNIETSEERILNNELKKLIRRANKRLLAIEKETGIKESFATKQLYDYLSANTINAITKGGRVSIKNDYTLMQEKAIIKAINDFMNSSYSSIKGIKAYKQKYSNIANKKLTYKMADTYYKVTHSLDWLWDSGITPSDFWKVLAPKVVSMDKESWTDLVKDYMTTTIDRTIRRNLEILYDYLKNG